MLSLVHLEGMWIGLPLSKESIKTNIFVNWQKMGKQYLNNNK